MGFIHLNAKSEIDMSFIILSDVDVLILSGIYIAVIFTFDTNKLLHF